MRTEWVETFSEMLESTRQIAAKARANAQKVQDVAQAAKETKEAIKAMPPTGTVVNLTPEQQAEKLSERALITDRQEEMMWYWEKFGVVGLALRMSHIAQMEQAFEAEAGLRSRVPQKRLRDEGDESDSDEQGGHSIWNKVIDDLDLRGDSRTLYYLSSLHPELIPALIRGDLPTRMQDPEFYAKVAPHVRPCRTQGTYLVYVDINDPGSETLAVAIESFSSPVSLNHNYQRKFAGGSKRDDFTVLSRWMDSFDRFVLAEARKALGTENETLLDIPHDRCWAYTGLSANCLRRSADHWTTSAGGSRLFALFFGTARHLFGDCIEVADSTYQIFKTVEVSDIGLDEIVTAILTCSHHTLGGLNYSHPGINTGANTNRTAPSYVEGLVTNRESIDTSGFQLINLQDSMRKMEKTSADLKKAQEVEEELPVAVQECLDLVDVIEKLQEEIELYEALAEYKLLENAIRELELHERMEEDQADRESAFGP